MLYFNRLAINWMETISKYAFTPRLHKHLAQQLHYLLALLLMMLSGELFQKILNRLF